MAELSFVVNKTENGKELDCAICLAPLSSKRIVVLDPCKHCFHRTCIISWFESLASPTVSWISNHTCCLCRAKASIKDEEGNYIIRLFPFEKYEEEIIQARLQFQGFYSGFNFDERLNQLRLCLATTSIRLRTLEEHKRIALASAKGKEYIDDIDQEKDMNENRSYSIHRIIGKLTEIKTAAAMPQEESIGSSEGVTDQVGSAASANLSMAEDAVSQDTSARDETDADISNE